MRWIVSFLVCAFVALAGGCRPAEELPELHHIEQVRLETSLGEELVTGDLDGRVHVVDFIFTSCQMACPLMTAKMKSIYDAYAEVPEVAFLSISTDPATDTVEVLHAYAERFGIDERRWAFARAPDDELKRVSEEEFLLGAAGFPVGHSLKFVLVDRERTIRGYYDSEDAEALERLRRHIDLLLG